MRAGSRGSIKEKMSSDQNNPPVKKTRIATRSYRGPDRREGRDTNKPSADSVKSSVKFDARGNAVLEWKVETPRRRSDDLTVNILKCLDLDSLSLVDDKTEEQQPDADFNPYGREKDIRPKR